jgi:hypothetical protein
MAGTMREEQTPQHRADIMATENAYGLWTLVVLNSAIFILFAFSFARPRSPRDWRSLGAF